MNYGMVQLAAVSCRAAASHKSEQINQLLFGDLYTVLEVGKDWIKISSHFDGYEGWIHHKHHTPLSGKAFSLLQTLDTAITQDALGILKSADDHLSLPPGCTIHLNEKKNTKINGRVYTYTGKFSAPKRADLFKHAQLYLNAPYLWGGRTPFGIDCSGFVQMTHKLSGIQLPRDSWQQAEVGRTVNGLNNARQGDLAFFGDSDRVTHVGILFSKKRIMHASGKVRMDDMRDEGIWNRETRMLTHKLKLIKRI